MPNDAPTWEDTLEAEPSWEDTAEESKPVPLDVRLKEPSAIPGIGPLGPTGGQFGQPIAPPNISELMGAYEAARKPFEKLHEALAPAASDFLARTGIDPSSTPDRVLNLPRVTPQAVASLPPSVFSALPGMSPLARFAPAAAAGMANLGLSTIEGFAQPEQAALLPLMAGESAVARIANLVLGAQQLAELPEGVRAAYEVIKDPNSTTEQKVEALGRPGVQAAFGALMTRAGMGRKGIDASSIREATYQNGNLRPPPREGEGQVPIERGGPGIQPQAEGAPPPIREEGGRPQVLLTPEQHQATLDLLAPHIETNKRLGLGHQVEIVPNFGERDPRNVYVAYADAPQVDEAGNVTAPGKITVNHEALQKWLQETPEGKRDEALKAFFSEEGIHALVTDADAMAYSRSLTRLERYLGQKLYAGARSAAELGLTGEKGEALLGHELLRQRLQRLLRLTPTEIAETAGREGWTPRALEALANTIRRIREYLGTKGAVAGREMTDRLLDRMTQGLEAATEGASQKAPEQPELIQHAYYEDENGETWMGANHPEVLDWIGQEGFDTPESRNTPQFGFITNKGRKLPRDQAEALAKQNGQDLSPFVGGERPKGAIHSDEVQEPGGQRPLGDTDQPVTPFDESRPFSIRRRPEGEPPKEPKDIALAIGPLKFDAEVDWKLPGFKPKWQFTLTVPGRETTFMTEAGATFDQVRRKAGIKLLQYDEGVADYNEAEKLYDSQHPEEAAAARPAAIRRKKESDGQQELFLPNVPQKAPVERAGFQAPTAQNVQDFSTKTVSDTVTAGKAPDFKDFFSKLQGQYGAELTRDHAYIAWQKAVNDRLLTAPGAELQKLIEDLGIRTKLENEFQAPFRLGTIADPAEPGRAPTAAQRHRFAAISGIFSKLSDEAGENPAKPWERTDVGPEDINQILGQRQFRTFSATDVQDPRIVGNLATANAAVDATGKGAPPRTVSKNLIALRDSSGRITLVSAWRDPRSGPRVTDPVRPTGTSQGINQGFLKDFTPVAVMSLRYPVKGFHKVFSDANSFYKWFGEPLGPTPVKGERPVRPVTPTEPFGVKIELPEGLSETSRELVTPGRKGPIPSAPVLYRMPRPAAAATLPETLQERLQAKAQAAAPAPEEIRAPSYGQPTGAIREVGKPARMGPGWPLRAGIEGTVTGRRTPASIRRKTEAREGFKELLRPQSELEQELRRDGWNVTPVGDAKNLFKFWEIWYRGKKISEADTADQGWRKIMDGQVSQPPAAIRRSAAAVKDELQALGHELAALNLRSGIADKVAYTRDTIDDVSNNYANQMETGIRLKSMQKPGSRLKQLLSPWERGNRQVLAAANAVIEAGGVTPGYAIDNAGKARLADFRKKVQNAITNARGLQQHANWRFRRIGVAWEKVAEQMLPEIDYAEAHWGEADLHATAAEMKRQLDQAYAREKAAGLELRRDPNYLPHRYDASLWDGRSLVANLFNPGRILGKNFRQQQIFPSHYDAIEAGPYFPVTRDGASLVGHRIRQGLEQIGRRLWQENLKTIDVNGRPFAIEPVKGVHDVWVSPDRDYELVSVRPGTKPLAVLSEYKSLMRALTGESPIEDWWLSRNALHFSQRLKHSLLVGDFFHLSRMLYYGASILGKDIGFKAGWSVLDVHPKDVAEAVRKGLIRQADADWGAEQVDVTEPGGPHQTMTRRELATKFYAKMGANLGKIQDALYKELISKHAPGAGPIRRGAATIADPTFGRYNRFLFDKLTRGLMTETAVREFERLHKANPSIPTEDLMRDIAKDTNTYFGNLGRQGFLKARWQQDVARMIWLAPQWVEGLVRKEATAYSRMSGLSRAMGRKNLPYLGTTGRGIARGMVFLFGLTQAINYITRGQSTFENKEKGHQLDAWIKGWGKDSEGFWFSPFAVFNEFTHDLWRLSHTKPTFASVIDQIEGNKESPLMRAFLIGRTGMGPTGEIQTSTGSLMGEIGKQFLPMPITFGRYLQAAGHAIAPGTVRAVPPNVMQRQAAATFGIKVEPAQTPSQRVHELARDFMQREGLQKDTGWREVMTSDPSYSKLRNSLRNDDFAGAKKVFDRMLKHGYTETEILKGMAKWSKGEFTGSKKNETPFIQSLTPQEADDYSKAQEQKQLLYEKFKEWWMAQP